MVASLTPQAFVAKWKQANLRERASAQEHFIDVCRLLGHPTPAEADPDGTWFTFEKGAGKATGGDGFADVWKQGFFGWEYKGKHGDLDKAYGQLLLYSGSLANPPLLIVSDCETIRIHTHFTNTVRVPYTLALEDLLVPEKLAILRHAFTNPAALQSKETTVQVTEKAARRFAEMAQLLRRYGNDPHEVAHFLIRLLFCLFAEDVGILPAGLFTKLVQQPRQNATTFGRQLKQLFAAMAEGGVFGVDIIQHVDGGLFNNDHVLPMDSDSLRILGEVSGQDWAAIEPAIFGTLFERGLDPDKRSQLGAHFTSKDDILLIVEPVLMAPLRRRWDEIKVLAQETVRIRDEAKSASQRAKVMRGLFVVLRKFREELAGMQVLDAACGSGNFLYVALRLLLDLEKEVINLAASLGDTVSAPMVSPTQLHGIEVNPYAYELAQATIWIGWIQWLRENGFGLPEEPILKPLETVRQMDAILAYDEAGRPVEPEWPAADVIIGNPPFLGDKKMRGELGDKYVEDLRSLYAGRVPGGADLVTYWFEKARAMIGDGKMKRAGLLATQGIRGGANRRGLERIKDTGDIFLAYSDRNWILDGAMVHVSLIGFDEGSESIHQLDGRAVEAINANLTASLNVTQAKRLAENAGLSFQGPVKVGPFDISDNLADSFLSQFNINGRPNADVIRPWMNGMDITTRPRNMHIIDFGERDLKAASEYEAPFEYVRRNIKPLRDANRDAQRRLNWWRLGRSGSDLRASVADKQRIIVTPRVSKHRLFIWAHAQLVPDSAVVAIASDDDYLFGILHSRIHELWARAMGTQLREAESGFRYTPTTTFETYPFPWPPGKEPAGDPRVEAIAEAARELVAKRDAWLNPPGAGEDVLKKRTLTNLYNERPMWLQLAHRRLDEAVLDAYGWPRELGDEEILRRLLELNLERASNTAHKETV